MTWMITTIIPATFVAREKNHEKLKSRMVRLTFLPFNPLIADTLLEARRRGGRSNPLPVRRHASNPLPVVGWTAFRRNPEPPPSSAIP